MINNGNRLICSDSSLSMPVTLFFSHHEPDSGKLTFVNASHNPPLFFKKSNSELSKLTRTAIFLGFDEDAAFQQATIELSQEDYIVFYTDDVPDATNIDNEEFGMDRFEALIGGNSSKSAEILMDSIKDNIKAFIGDNPPYDDLAILIMKSPVKPTCFYLLCSTPFCTCCLALYVTGSSPKEIRIIIIKRKRFWQNCQNLFISDECWGSSM